MPTMRPHRAASPHCSISITPPSGPVTQRPTGLGELLGCSVDDDTAGTPTPMRQQAGSLKVHGRLARHRPWPGREGVGLAVLSMGGQLVDTRTATGKLLLAIRNPLGHDTISR